MNKAALFGLRFDFIIRGQEVRYDNAQELISKELRDNLLSPRLINMGDADLLIREFPVPLVLAINLPTGLIGMDKRALS